MHRCMRQATPLGPQGRPGKRPSSSDLNRAFNNLGPPPRIPSALSEETLSEIAPSPKSSFASVEPPKDHEKQAPTSWNNVQNEGGRAEASEESVREGEQRILEAVNYLRAAAMGNRDEMDRRRREYQAGAREHMLSVDTYLIASHRCVLTFYSAGGLFFTIRFLREVCGLDEYSVELPSPRSQVVLRQLLMTAFRCLRLTLEVGNLQDALDIIQNYGVFDVVCAALHSFPEEWELHVSSLDLLCFLLDRTQGHDLQHEVENGSIISTLGQVLSRVVKQVRRADPYMHQTLFLALEVSRRLCANRSHGSKSAVGLALYQNWYTLKALLQLLTLRQHVVDAHDDPGGLPEAVLELLEGTACALLLCMVARSSIVANKLSCQAMVPPIVAAIRRHPHDKEILRWLKGALLEFEACRVRGNLNEKPPTLISMLQAAGLGVGGEKEAPVPKPGNGKRRDNMSASEFAQSVLQDYHMKKRWLRTIDSYIHRNAPSVEVEMARDQKRAHAAARAAQRAWDPFGSPYAQPVVPGLFKDQKPQRWRAPRPAQHRSALQDVALDDVADELRSSALMAGGKEEEGSHGGAGKKVPAKGGGGKTTTTTTIHADQPIKKKRASKANRHKHAEEFGLIPDAAIAATWNRQHQLQVVGGQQQQQQPAEPQLVYTEESMRSNLSTIARRLLGDPPQEAYVSSVVTAADRDKPEIDKMSYSERLQVMLLSVDRSLGPTATAEASGGQEEQAVAVDDAGDATAAVDDAGDATAAVEPPVVVLPVVREVAPTPSSAGEESATMPQDPPMSSDVAPEPPSLPEPKEAPRVETQKLESTAKASGTLRQDLSPTAKEQSGTQRVETQKLGSTAKASGTIRQDQSGTQRTSKTQKLESTAKASGGTLRQDLSPTPAEQSGTQRVKTQKLESTARASGAAPQQQSPARGEEQVGTQKLESTGKASGTLRQDLSPTPSEQSGTQRVKTQKLESTARGSGVAPQQQHSPKRAEEQGGTQRTSKTQKLESTARGSGVQPEQQPSPKRAEEQGGTQKLGSTPKASGTLRHDQSGTQRTSKTQKLESTARGSGVAPQQQQSPKAAEDHDGTQRVKTQKLDSTANASGTLRQDPSGTQRERPSQSTEPSGAGQGQAVTADEPSATSSEEARVMSKAASEPSATQRERAAEAGGVREEEKAVGVAAAASSLPAGPEAAAEAAREAAQRTWGPEEMRG